MEVSNLRQQVEAERTSRGLSYRDLAAMIDRHHTTVLRSLSGDDPQQIINQKAVLLDCAEVLSISVGDNTNA